MTHVTIILHVFYLNDHHTFAIKKLLLTKHEYSFPTSLSFNSIEFCLWFSHTTSIYLVKTIKICFLNIKRCFIIPRSLPKREYTIDEIYCRLLIDIIILNS